jgi:zinc transporter ZupT
MASSFLFLLLFFLSSIIVVSWKHSHDHLQNLVQFITGVSFFAFFYELLKNNKDRLFNTWLTKLREFGAKKILIAW